MKAFTDISQSRKLAEILPLESADMSWVSNGLGRPFARTIPIKGDPEELCACWSLTALLDVLPEGTRLLKSATDDTYHFIVIVPQEILTSGLIILLMLVLKQLKICENK